MAEDQDTLLEADLGDVEESETPCLSFEPSGRSSWSPRPQKAKYFDFSNKYLKHVGEIVVVILAALLGLVVGLLIGRSLHRGSSESCSSEKPTAPSPSNAVPLLDWGDTATLTGGEEVDVMEVFESQFTTETIRNYL